jgi:hypothetical protein
VLRSRSTGVVAACALVVSSTILTVTFASPGGAASAQDDGRPRSVMVQVSTLAPTYGPNTLASWLKQLCTSDVSPDQSRDLILQDIASMEGALATPYLDVLTKFFPGGKQACFTRVFVGTVDLPWSSEGSKYREGVLNADFVRRYLSLSSSVAAAFTAHYPRAIFNWHLTYEANLNELAYPEVEIAYRSMLVSEMQSLATINPQAGFSWSPAFWYPYSAYKSNVVGMTMLRQSLDDLFSSLAKTATGLELVDLQDFVAGSSCQPSWNQVSPDDAVSWARFLTSLGTAPAIALNVEQYAVDCDTGGIRPGDRQALSDRQAFYASHGVAIGPAFEIRYVAGAQ